MLTEAVFIKESFLFDVVTALSSQPLLSPQTCLIEDTLLGGTLSKDSRFSLIDLPIICIS